MQPDSKVHGANMGPIWGRQDPGGPHIGPMNLAIRVYTSSGLNELVLWLWWDRSFFQKDCKQLSYLAHWGRDKMATISIKNSPKSISNGPINNIPALVQIMAWRRLGDKPLSEPMMAYYTGIYMHDSASMSQH